jgi:hypothetical protein
MAFPSTVTGAWPNHLNSTAGIFVNGSNLYVFTSAPSTLDLTANKSTDGGDTWSAVGTSPGLSSVFNVIQNGTSTYAAGFINSAVRIVPFDMTTDTWGTSITGGPTINQNVAATTPVYFCLRSDGTYVMTYQGSTESVMGTAYRRVKIHYYNGSWNGPYDLVGSANSPPANTLPGTQAHHDLRFGLLGSSDRFHCFYTSSAGSSLLHRPFLSGNTFATANNSGSGTIDLGNYAAGIVLAYVDGSDTKLVIPCRHSFTLDLQVFRATSADTLSWSTQTVSTTQPEITTSNPAASVAVGTTVHLFFVNDADVDIYRDNDQGSGTWQADVEWKDAVTCGGINARTFTYSGTDYIGVLYRDSSVVKFDRYQLSSAATSSPFFHRSARFVRLIRR